jgi:hypothetical protein
MPDAIRASLAEAIAWCSRPGRSDDRGSGLRTPNLNPHASVLKPKDATAKAIVEHLCHQRRQRIIDQGIPAVAVDAGLKTGRILAICLGDVIGCESSRAATDGFFDSEDLPGWDSWFHLGRCGQRADCVFAWIPEAFTKTAQEGIAVSPTECIFWVESLDAIGA